MKYYLCADIGGTACKIGILDNKGNILTKIEESVNFDNYKTPIIETVVTTIRKLLNNNYYEIDGIAVSSTGQIDTNKGVVIGTCGNIPNFIGSNFKERFEKEFNILTTVINDANCMILGEKWIGKCKNDSNAIGITIGTGIGGGIIVNDQILLGTLGIAAELGHMIIKKDSDLCTCKNKGCYEILGSTKYLCERVSKQLKGDWDGRKIFDELRNGNNIIKNIIDEWIDDIATGIISLVHIFNPSVVLIGGGVSNEKELLINPLRKKVLSKVMPSFAKNLRIESAKLKNNAGMVGALYFHLIQRGIL